ncbi:MAG TPA: phosphatase PAP2 family protein [Acidimicrobiales bacterium]|nr:phosphatase PAP2 family protein [Acidimicrobiales bacterium]
MALTDATPPAERSGADMLEWGPGRRWRTWLAAAVAWMGRRHRFGAELAALVLLYVVYDSARGFVATGTGVAVAHARLLESSERLLHLDIEHTVQRLAHDVPVLLTTFGLGYTTLHLAVMGAVLLWLFRTDAAAYVRLRCAVVISSVIALVGFVFWPTAPPRLAGVGIVGTLSQSGVNLESHALSFLYNPYAAFPSLHEAFAVLAGYALWRWCRWRPLRAVGVVYPVWVAVEVIATGNHFLLDVVAGAGVAVLGLVAAGRLRRAAEVDGTAQGEDVPALVAA